MMRFLKRALQVLGSIAALLVAVLMFFYLRGSSRLGKTYEAELAALRASVEPTLPTDAESIAHGKRWVLSHCSGCHGEDLGGKSLVEGEGFGVLAAPNLTPGKGGRAQRFGPRDWVRALRHGIDSEGHPLAIMPSQHYRFLGDRELLAMVAYLEQAPPVDREVPARRLEFLPRVFLGAGVLGDFLPAEAYDHAEKIPPPPVAAVTTDYGHYLVRTGGCAGCHGADLAGGKVPGPDGPPTPNLTPAGALGKWNEELFLQMVRTRESEHMPWKHIRQMTEVDLRALWTYLASLPPRVREAK